LSDASHRRSHEPTEFIGGSAPSKPKEVSSLLELARGEACLVIANGPRREAEFPLRADEVVIGRDADADITIDEPSASRRHAVIRKGRFGHSLRDLGTTNGTYLYGLLHGAEKLLMDGDRFRIGRTEFVFYDASAAAARRDR
jgi:pSer/pThr/pTyr-binding forkhead associated (FHA) protein